MPGGQVDSPEAVLWLQAFNSSLEFIWSELPNPRNLEFRPLRSSLQTDDGSRFQLHTQRAEPSSILSDVNGMCQMCDLVDEDLDRQDHFSAGVFSFVEHQDTIMVCQRVRGEVTAVMNRVAGGIGSLAGFVLAQNAAQGMGKGIEQEGF